MRPVILVTPDIESVSTRRGDVATYVLDRHYANAIAAAGGVPVVVPYTNDDDSLEAALTFAHGVLLTGGGFDVDPALFDEAPHPRLGTLKPERTLFETALFQKARARNLPVLGICGGMQLVNCLLGGDLWQDLPTQLSSTVAHEQKESKAFGSHAVTIVDDETASLLGREPLAVNSTHHQGVRLLAKDLVATCVADDGLVEGFREAHGSFLWGVQWHPEAMTDRRHLLVYQAFVDAAKTNAVKNAARR